MMMVPRRNGFDIFDEVFNEPFFTKKENKLMKTDVREKDGNYVLDIDLPGYNKEDIKIDLTDGYLTVTAKREEHKEENEHHGNYIRGRRATRSRGHADTCSWRWQTAPACPKCGRSRRWC